jgi:hypothetical protein
LVYGIKVGKNQDTHPPAPLYFVKRGGKSQIC